MTSYGYKLSCEEHPAPDLVRYAQRAEQVGFEFGAISDHFHPWIDKQGQSPFVWSVIGGIATTTDRLRLGTAVTCPTIRIHPAIVAQAAATAETMMPGRFFLGVGTGENLNEHVLGDQWPNVPTRREMLENAIEVIRTLWEGDLVTRSWKHYSLDGARIYSRPETPPAIYVAGSGTESAELAGRIGDGYIGTSPQSDTIEAFDRSGGSGKPRVAEVQVCWARNEQEARKTATEWWPNVAIPGELGQELPLPRHFEQAAKNVTEDAVAELVACGPDPERHLETIGKFTDAGFDHVAIHQIGPDQAGFFDFYEREVLPKLG
jgi:coenzyme F420-dependent glucose-6-phosphate dehydrogenase